MTTTCSRARSHKLRCSATPIAHDYRQQRADWLDVVYPHLIVAPPPTVAYEVRGGRRHRTRLYGNAYQPCPARPPVRLANPRTGETMLRFACDAYEDPYATARCVAYVTEAQRGDGGLALRACCSEGLPTYPYTPRCP